MSKNKDALKFFQAYIKEMIDIGGINLPKSISAALGAKLGNLLKKRGIIGLENNLKQIYNALNAKTQIKSINDNTIEITVSHSSNFCPIGGKPNPERGELVRDTICKPYTMAFLNIAQPEIKYNIKTIECILDSNHKDCIYQLIKESKNN
ncbi:MAG: hypothetical protein ACFFC3_08305 [Candidatus Odinarchaeota archaeon]